MLLIERVRKPDGCLYLNKNIYDHRQLLIWPAYTPVTSKLLETANKLGVSLSNDDMADARQTLLQAADTAFDELAVVFREAGDTGVVRIRELRRSAIPVMKSTISTGSLTSLLVHLRRKDDVTLRHSLGVGVLSLMLGRWLKLSEHELEDLVLAALLHDIGKLRVDRRVLGKPGQLTKTEYEEMKNHTVYGYEILGQIAQIPKACALAALRHHERYNGTGYPYRIKDEEIDLFSRIIMVTDVFHAMCSKRPYKETMPLYQVIREMHDSAFGQFDPGLALVFLSHMMEALVGTDVMLTNGKRARIVALNASDPLRPLLQANGDFIDLSKDHHTHIADYN